MVHCKCASCVISAAMHSLCAACASFARSAGLAAYRVTSTRRLKLNKSFSRAGHVDVQCVVDDKVDLGRTSTPELACDAVTAGTLSAGDLSWCCELAHLLFSWCSPSRNARVADFETFVPLLLSHVRVFVSEVDGSMTLDERHRTMQSRHAADGRPGQEGYGSARLTLFVWDCQNLLS